MAYVEAGLFRQVPFMLEELAVDLDHVSVGGGQRSELFADGPKGLLQPDEGRSRERHAAVAFVVQAGLLLVDLVEHLLRLALFGIDAGERSEL